MLIDDVLEFLRASESATLDEIVERFIADAHIPARVEALLLHLLHRGLICEPREFNRFELTDSGKDMASCARQERARLKQRKFLFKATGQ